VESSSSGFKFTWFNGRSIDGTLDVIKPPTAGKNKMLKDDKVVDIVSIGSKHSKDLHKTQLSTWASHSSIRYFFGVTEEDDAYPDCDTRLTMEGMIKFSDNCVSKLTKTKYIHSPIAASTATYFAKGDYLKTKNPGWLCAQKRPLYAMAKLIRFYRKLLQNRDEHQEDYASDLPDYMILVDDDTYYNMDLFQNFVRSWKEDPSFPRIEAGCLIKQPLHLGTNFSHPFGGFGLVFSRGSIENLMRPLPCNVNTGTTSNETHGDPFYENACRQLKLNWFGETPSFEEGMSVSDLMIAHSSRHAYYSQEALNTRLPFCFHSDWAMGHYMNHYHISSHVSEFSEPDEHYKYHYNWHRGMPTVRMGWSFGILYANEKKNPPRNCKHDGEEKCHVSAMICHHLTGDQIKEIYDQVQEKKTRLREMSG